MALKPIKGLEVLSIIGNHFTSDDEYSQYILASLSQLKYFDYIYIDDAVRGLLSIANAEFPTSSTFNLGSGSGEYAKRFTTPAQFAAVLTEASAAAQRLLGQRARRVLSR